MNMFARFDENPAMTLRVIKETKRNGRTDARTDNVKIVYPPTNKVCGGYNNSTLSLKAPAYMHLKMLTAQVVCCIYLQTLLIYLSERHTAWTQIRLIWVYTVC